MNLLLEHGADPNLLDDHDKTAMHYAISLGHKEIFEVRGGEREGEGERGRERERGEREGERKRRGKKEK